MVSTAIADLDQLDIEALKALVIAKCENLDSHAQQIEHLKLIIEKLRRMLFGSKSEKVSIQLEQLELQLEETESVQATDEVSAERPVVDTPKSRPSRKPLPAHLSREVITHHPEQDCCPDCGGQLRNFGEDVAEVLEYIPANFKVIRHVRPKFACKQCEHVVQASAPSRTIKRGLAGPGLLAHVLVAKYADHLPLYRSRRSMLARALTSTAPRWPVGSAQPASCSRHWSRLYASMSCLRTRFMPTILRFRYSLPATARPRRAAYGPMFATIGHRAIRPRQPCGSPTHPTARENIQGNI
jgi:transposase